MLAILKYVLLIGCVSAGDAWTREEYVGGASIIHPQVALTAAHKVERRTPKMLKCRAGALSRVTAEAHTMQDRGVVSFHTHPRYDRTYTAYDVTLIRLERPFDVTPAVRPLCVGRGRPPRPDQCFATGWGRREFNSSDYAEKLKKVGVPLVPRGLCQNALQAVDDQRRRMRGWKPVERGALHSTLLCAGGEGLDACTGDGGAPLVCLIEKVNATRVRYAAYGLVAWGLGCGVDGAPGVYVDVSKLYDWIISELKTIVIKYGLH